MSWFNRRILTDHEVKAIGPTELPSRFQVGQEAHLAISSDEGKARLPCRVIAVQFTSSKVIYTIAFSLGNGLWIPIDDIHDGVTGIDELIAGDVDCSPTPPEEVLAWLKRLYEAENYVACLTEEPKLKLAAIDGKVME